MDSEKFITDQALRVRVQNHTEILDRVKELRMIPTADFVSQEMVAQYYEVSVSAIKHVVTRHKDEVETAGMIHQSKADLIEKLKFQNGTLTMEKLPYNKGTRFTYEHGAVVLVPNRGLRTFSKSAVYAVGLLLQDSPIAKQIRLEAVSLLIERDEKEQKTNEYNECDNNMNVYR